MPACTASRYFNSRPSARGDRWSYPSLRAQHNFNSRPSARGDSNEMRKLQTNLISIHAPPRGATVKTTVFFSSSSNFNSRPSARGDLLVLFFFIRVFQISIHAPPRGATPPTQPHQGSQNISIHAPPRGATKSSADCKASFRFQFTPLREGRRSGAMVLFGWHTISIHAPPRGATRP